MEYVRKTIGAAALDGVFDLPPALRNRRVEVIILPADDNEVDEKSYEKRPIGFAKGAEVPSSFFEPLSEEDLQAWGL